MMEMRYFVLSSMVAISHLATEHLKWTSASEELNFLFYLILINFKLNNHMWLEAPILDSASLAVWC